MEFTVCGEAINMKLTMLGTGNAFTTEFYNTCFAITDGDKGFLVDGGGGGTILGQLKHGGVDWRTLRHIFLSHKHVDHILGIVYMMRYMCQKMNEGSYDGEVFVYGHDEVLDMLRSICEKLLQPKQFAFIDDKVHFVVVNDGDKKDIYGHEVTFFDIESHKAKQFGFSMDLGNGEKLTCCGDEPCSPNGEKYAKDAKWLLHEAFCLYEDREVQKPYEKAHATCKEAGELAERMNVKNLILYHTEDQTYLTRKERYVKEAKQYFSGNVFMPDDLETFEL